MSLAKLLEFRGKLKEASNLLKDAETTIAAMLIIDDYRWLDEVEALVERALERIREARKLARELVEEVERALPPEPLEEEP
jgi:sugar phosphate isomerase/epimerase